MLYVFESLKKKSKNLWRNLHMFLDILAFTVENKKKY